ncbi:MAG: pentapeptide repeat-containing protein [Alphaproteobacteria bacterium]|nr:pentapeptide repeat-containing protein [Alphaproteobacteria bacterium]
MNSLQGDSSKPIRVVVTGRMPSFQAARKELSATGTASCEVTGFCPSPYLTALITDPLGKVDQRREWWEKYAPLAGLPLDVPAAITDQRLQSLTHEPLLCYLLALSGYAVENWEAAAENRNRIYGRLIDEVWRRGWGEGDAHVRREGAGKSLGKGNFNRLMETIALAAWRGGDTRVASEAGFHEAVALLRTQDAWEDFKRDSGQDIANLAMNFYLKSAESEYRGFEFTHKSFGDYLAARALLCVARDVALLGERGIDHAMREWLKVTSRGELTNELMSYLRDEIRLLIGEQDGLKITTEMKRAFEKLASSAIRDGFPSHQSSAQSWRVAENWQRNAETMVWAILNACTVGLNLNERGEHLINVVWVGPQDFAWLIMRLSKMPGNALQYGFVHKYLDELKAMLATRDLVSEPVFDCFSYVNSPNMDFSNLNLTGINFRYANLSGSKFRCACLSLANFSRADLTKATFEDARVDLADFAGAKLAGAELSDARVAGASFTGADLTDVKLSKRMLSLQSKEEMDPKLASLFGKAKIEPVETVERDSE